MHLVTILNAFEVEQLDQNLKLLVETSVKLESLEEITLPLPEQCGYFRQPDLQSCWYSGGSSFRFNISLYIENYNQESMIDFDHILASLSETLSIAKLWEQLQLKPSVSYELHRVAQALGYAEITIELRSNHSRLGDEKTYHDISLSVPVCDFKPPSTIRAIYLREVDLKITLQDSRPIQKYQSHMELMPSSPPSYLWEVIPDREDYLDSQQTQDDYDAGSPQRCELMQGFDSQTSLDKGDFDQNSDGSAVSECRHAEDFPMSVPSDPSFSAEACPSPDAIGSTSNERDDRRTFDLQGVIDAVIRCSIAHRPSKLTLGICVRRHNNFISLEHLAPSIFSPGYLWSVAHRAALIPRISYSIQSIYMSSSSTAFKSSVDAIEAQERQESHIGLDESVTTIEPPTTTQLLEARLWKITMCEIYDPTAANGLKPLFSTVTDSSMDYELEASTETAGATSLFQSGHAIEFDTTHADPGLDYDTVSRCSQGTPPFLPDDDEDDLSRLFDQKTMSLTPLDEATGESMEHQSMVTPDGDIYHSQAWPFYTSSPLMNSSMYEGSVCLIDDEPLICDEDTDMGAYDDVYDDANDDVKEFRLFS